MTNTETKINKQRQYWIDKINKQNAELMFLSMEGKQRAFQSLWDDLETSYICLYRFDSKLRQERNEQRSKARQTDDEEIS